MEAKQKLYAGFWRRFTAYMIDTAILAFFFNILYNFFIPHCRLMYAIFEFDFGETLQIFSLYFPLVMNIILLSWCYYCGMESSPLQASIGKKLMGLYVTDTDGNRITFGKATLRYFLKGLSVLFFYAGYIMAAFTNNKQAFHDMLAGCLVLRK